MSTPLRLGLGTLLVGGLVVGVLGSPGCVVVTDSNSDAGDTGIVTDTGVGIDTGVATDTGTDTTPVVPAVIIPAKQLVGGVADDIRDFSGGSTKADLVTGGRIAYAVASVGSNESAPIGKDATDAFVDGRLTGLPAGTAVTIKVTGYLRGLTGKNAEPATERIPWAVTTCTATPDATKDVTATCTKLALIADLKGIVISSDVLPPGYCGTKGPDGTKDFEAYRARTPYSGSAIASRYVNDCKGVIFIPEADFASSEVGGVSEWSLSLEAKSSSTACTATAPCRVDRKTGGSKIDIYVVGNECALGPSTASPTSCF